MKRSACLIFVLGALMLTHAWAEDPDDCEFSIEATSLKGKEIEFDLSGFKRKSDNPFSVKSGDSTYYWNACAKVDPKKLGCANDFATNKEFAVIQKDADGTCYDLGGFTTRKSAQVDVNNILSGIVMKYESFADCVTASEPVKRKTSVRYVCNPLAAQTTFSARETNVCEYEIEVQSQAACPESCRTSNKIDVKSCSGHGICAVDPVASDVRCLCNNGYAGETCGTTSKSESGSKSTTPLLAGLAITLMILLILVTISIVRTVRKLSAGDSHYNRMATIPGMPSVQPGRMGAEDPETSLPQVPFPDVTDLPQRPVLPIPATAAGATTEPRGASRKPAKPSSKVATVSGSEQTEL